MAELPPALRRAVALMEVPPVRPAAERGFLDLLPAQPQVKPGRAQSIWLSGPGAALYDRVQGAARRLTTAARPPAGALDLRPGEIVLDIGCGPGPLTPALARSVGPDGLALGLDVSAAMLARAATGPLAANLGYLRADATGLPFRAASVDAVVSLALLQLIDDPGVVLGECARVLRPGGRLTLMVPNWPWQTTRPWAERAARALGIRIFDLAELPASVRAHGFEAIREQWTGPLQWIAATATS